MKFSKIYEIKTILTLKQLDKDLRENGQNTPIKPQGWIEVDFLDHDLF